MAVDFLDGEDPADYATDLINTWGVGQKDEDNGVVVLLARGDRRIQIGTGTGIDRVLTGSKCGELIDKNIDYFASNDFDAGLVALYQDVCTYVARAKGKTLALNGAGTVGAGAGSAGVVRGAENGRQNGGGGGLLDTILNLLFAYIVISIIVNVVFKGDGCMKWLFLGWLFGGRNNRRDRRRPPRPPMGGGMGGGPRPPMGGGMRGGPRPPMGGGFGGGGSRGGGFGGGFGGGGFGGGGLGDLASLGITLGAMGSVVNMTKDALNPMMDASAQMGQAIGGTMAGGTASGWECSCGAKNIQSKFCPECGAKKPEPKQGWTCPECGTADITSKFCPECGCKKPEAPAAWDCPQCGNKGITGKFCGECGCRKPEAPATWDCPECGNKGISAKFCPECGHKWEA